jgi:GTP cyclohydrolase II
LDPAWEAFTGLLQDEAQVAMDRALAELRAGRPILLESAQGSAMLTAVDALSAAALAALATHPAIALVLPKARARALGLAVECAVALPLAGLDHETVRRLAGGAESEAPASWSPADAMGLMGIELCKQALLLPAVLIAEIGGGAELADPPLPIHRLALAEAQAALGQSRLSLEIVSRARIPLPGDIEASFIVFRGAPVLRDQLAVVVGDPDPEGPVALRLHSACLTGDLFGSLRCDCGDQLRKAVTRLAEAGGGVLLYLDQEGRGTGLRNKMRAYALQDAGLDTIDADAMLGYGADERRYDIAAGMLLCLGYRQVRLLTNNPEKIAALRRAGIEVREVQPLAGLVTVENRRYLSTKARRAGHTLEDLPLEALVGPPRRAEGGRGR